MKEPRWYTLSDKRPEQGQKVLIMDSGGNVSETRFERGLFFLNSGMYIYYVPTFWRPL